MSSAIEPKTKTLPSGKVATLEAFKGRHVREAQKLVSGTDGDEGSIAFALIALLVTIDGKKIVMEDLDEMHGPDVLELLGEFTAANFR